MAMSPGQHLLIRHFVIIGKVGRDHESRFLAGAEAGCALARPSRFRQRERTTFDLTPFVTYFLAYCIERNPTLVQVSRRST
jgi:hypothetical protein